MAATSQRKSSGGIILVLRAGATPVFEKTLRECSGKWKSFIWVPRNPENRSGSCSENFGFCIAQVVRCHSENGVSYAENQSLNSKSCSKNAPELSESSENGCFSWNWGGPQASDLVLITKDYYKIKTFQGISCCFSGNGMNDIRQAMPVMQCGLAKNRNRYEPSS